MPNIVIRTLKRDGICNCCAGDIRKDIDEVLTFQNYKPPYTDIIICKDCVDRLNIPDYEVIDIVRELRHNLDEAEQFEPYIDHFIKTCPRSVLVSIAKELAESVRYNQETPYMRHNLSASVEDIVKLIKKVEELE